MTNDKGDNNNCNQLAKLIAQILSLVLSATCLALTTYLEGLV